MISNWECFECEHIKRIEDGEWAHLTGRLVGASSIMWCCDCDRATLYKLVEKDRIVTVE